MVKSPSVHGLKKDFVQDWSFRVDFQSSNQKHVCSLASDKSDLVWNLTFDFVSTQLLVYLPKNVRAETPMCIEILCTGLAVYI